MRYGELVTSLGTIATNLLADRLRGLETSGVVERRLGEKGGVVYGLTPWGSELREGIEALVRWSTPLMVRGPDDDSFQPRWLAVALPALLRGRTAEPPAENGTEVPGSFLTVRIDEDGPHVTVEPDHRPFDGLVLPTRRRVRPRGPGSRSLPGPILVGLDLGEIEVEH